jgi:hypothetical protein
MQCIFPRFLNILDNWVFYFYVICFARIEIICICTKYRTSVSFSPPRALEWRLNVYGNFVWIDETHCVSWLAYGLDERGSVPITVQENFPLSNPSFLDCLQLGADQWSFQRGNIWRKFNLTVCLRLVPAQRMRGCITLLHNNQPRYLLYHITKTIRPAPVPGCNSVKFSMNSYSD